MKQPLTARSSTRLSGRVRVPGDKSISHRALILGALATGTTRIAGLLEAEDVAATANALSALGAEVERSNGRVTVRGQGIGGLRAPSAPLDFGNRRLIRSAFGPKADRFEKPAVEQAVCTAPGPIVEK